MKTVPLHGTKAAGRVALVDDEDYDLVMQYRWRVKVVPRVRRQSPIEYVTASVVGSPGRSILMHKLITGHPQTDHRNHDGLDNQRANLRPASQAQNRQNSLPLQGCASPYKGVTRAPRSGNWRAKITSNGREIYLGTFLSDLEAAHAYDLAAVREFGEFAYVNLPSLLSEAGTRFVAELVAPEVRRLTAERSEEIRRYYDDPAVRAARAARMTGERNSSAKLTFSQATEIRARYAAGGVMQKVIAADYGVSQALISAIVTGKLWADA